MKTYTLKELDTHSFYKPNKSGSKLLGLAFLCPCCMKEYLTVFFEPTPYADQKERMSLIVADVEAASWVPYPSFEAAATANEQDLSKITIRPGIDARAVGHTLVTVSHGEVSH